jgi:ureidoglycolate hydrolase
MTTVRLNLQPLTEEAFLPYGRVWGHPNIHFPEADEGVGHATCVQCLTHERRYNDSGQLAIHFSFDETYIPLTGGMVLLVAPPPLNSDPGAEDDGVDYDRLASFLIEPPQIVTLHRGVYHNVLSTTAECRLVSVARKAPGSPATDISKFDDAERAAGGRRFIKLDRQVEIIAL